MQKIQAWHKDAKQIIEDEIYVGEVYSWLHQGQPLLIRRPTEAQGTNGQEIYEGDIIQISDPSSAHRIQVVVFKDGGFCGYSELKSSPYTWLDTLTRANRIVDVIGNIYQNPELLEGKGIVHNTQRVHQSIS